MYARTSNNRVALDVVQAVCKARARNFRVAKIHAATSVFNGWFA